MLNCKEVTRLVSEGLDHRLSWWQRFNLRFHVTMCGACHAYKRQVEAIHRLLAWRLKADPASGNPLSLSPQKREHIKQLLQTDTSSPPH